MRRLILLSLVAILSTSAQAELRDEALAAASKATNFYWKELSTEGGYLWRYSADLRLREGEGKIDTATAWVQPPGTPSLGEAYVKLYEATGDRQFLNAALAAADVLRLGQLRSGGWNAGIELDPERRKSHAYRVDPPGKKNKRNQSSLDDDKTQSALRFLIQLDRATKFENKAVHKMTVYGLDHLLKAQLENGGFPQVWE